MAFDPVGPPVLPARALTPDLLGDPINVGAHIMVECLVSSIGPRLTPEGRRWAVLDATWRGRAIRAVAFPTVWNSMSGVPRVGHCLRIRGVLAFREGHPVVRVLRAEIASAM